MKLIYILLFLPIFCFSQTPKTLLWKIEGKNLKEPSYLYGTMHVKDNRAFQFGDSVKIAFDSSKLFALELNLDSVNQLSAMMAMMMSGDTTLKTLLSKKKYKKVNDAFKAKTGMSLALMNKIKPVFVSVMLSENDYKNDKSVFVDQHFFNLAKEQKKIIKGVETMEEQVSVFDKVPLKEQAKQLYLATQVKEDTSKTNKESKKLIDAYAEGDLDALLKMTTDSKMSDQMNKDLIVNRNIVMAKRIGQMIQTHNSFIAIGAAHLPGNMGVIELLKKDGYSVNPVFSK